MMALPAASLSRDMSDLLCPQTHRLDAYYNIRAAFIITQNYLGDLDTQLVPDFLLLGEVSLADQHG